MARTHCNWSVQSGDQFAASPELDRGIREVVANRLAISTEMGRQERFRYCRKRTPVFGAAETVAFIRIVEISHRYAVLLHCRDDLLGLGGFDPHVIGTLANQQGPDNLAGAIER